MRNATSDRELVTVRGYREGLSIALRIPPPESAGRSHVQAAPCQTSLGSWAVGQLGALRGWALIENVATGEQIEFDTENPDVLVMYSTWTRPGHRALEHLHPVMEERFEVLAGRAAFRVGGRQCEAGPGEMVVVPAGVQHLAWNPTDEPVRLRIEMRPPMRWEEFTRRLFDGEDSAVLLAEYDREVRLSVAG